MLKFKFNFFNFFFSILIILLLIWKTTQSLIEKEQSFPFAFDEYSLDCRQVYLEQIEKICTFPNQQWSCFKGSKFSKSIFLFDSFLL